MIVAALHASTAFNFATRAPPAMLNTRGAVRMGTPDELAIADEEVAAPAVDIVEATGKIVPTAFFEMPDEAVYTRSESQIETQSKSALRDDLSFSMEMEWLSELESNSPVTIPEVAPGWPRWAESEREEVGQRISAASKRETQVKLRSAQLKDELKASTAKWENRVSGLETLHASTAASVDASNELCDGLTSLQTSVTLTGQQIVGKYQEQKSVAERVQIELTSARGRLADLVELRKLKKMEYKELLESQVAPHRATREKLSVRNGELRATSARLEMVDGHVSLLEGQVGKVQHQLSVATQLMESKLQMVKAIERQVAATLEDIANEEAALEERKVAQRQLEQQDKAIVTAQAAASEALTLGASTAQQLSQLMSGRQASLKCLAPIEEHVDPELRDVSASYELREAMEGQVSATLFQAAELAGDLRKMQSTSAAKDQLETIERQARLSELQADTIAVQKSLSCKTSHAEDLSAQLKELKCAYRKAGRDISEMEMVKEGLDAELDRLHASQRVLRESKAAAVKKVAADEEELLVLRMKHAKDKAHAERVLQSEKKAVEKQHEIVHTLEATLRSFSELRRALPHLAAAEQGRVLVGEAAAAAAASNTELEVQCTMVDAQLCEAKKKQAADLEQMVGKIQDAELAAAEEQMNLANLKKYQDSLAQQREAAALVQY